MIVEIDDKSGFCFGVVRAISAAESALKEHSKVCSLGDIVHNRIEVQRLEQIGLRTIHSHDEIKDLKAESMLVRAHGEPPTTFQTAMQHGVEVIDATCPVVARLQRKIISAHTEMQAINGQVVLLGKRGHAEVIGLTGQVHEPTIVVEGVSDLDLIDFTRPIYFLSQTTQSIKLFNDILFEMQSRAGEFAHQIIPHDTICRQVSNREEHLTQFSQNYDVIIFVSGKKSSNGKVLFEVCRRANPQSYNIEEASEIDPEWLSSAERVGICGATSTPNWLMQQVAQSILDRDL